MNQIGIKCAGCGREYSGDGGPRFRCVDCGGIKTTPIDRWTPSTPREPQMSRSPSKGANYTNHVSAQRARMTRRSSKPKKAKKKTEG